VIGWARRRQRRNVPFFTHRRRLRFPDPAIYIVYIIYIFRLAIKKKTFFPPRNDCLERVSQFTLVKLRKNRSDGDDPGSICSTAFPLSPPQKFSCQPSSSVSFSTRRSTFVSFVEDDCSEWTTIAGQWGVAPKQFEPQHGMDSPEIRRHERRQVCRENCRGCHRVTTPYPTCADGRSHMLENRIALVCSARSAATKAEGTTNRYPSCDYEV